MKAFLILSIIIATLLGLSNAQQCSPACTREFNPQCGVTAKCVVSADNPCILRYKSCILDQFHMSPIIDVLPGRCPIYLPTCPVYHL